MNCPVRVDPDPLEGHNQNPPSLANDATTRADLNGVANSRLQRDHRIDLLQGADHADIGPDENTDDAGKGAGVRAKVAPAEGSGDGAPSNPTERKTVFWSIAEQLRRVASNSSNGSGRGGVGGADFGGEGRKGGFKGAMAKTRHVLVKYSKFIGPGFMVSVAYIDPGNYATDVAAGATFRFRLLFIILLSNIFAIFLQSLCVKLGTVTGMNLAENCKAHLPRWLNYVLYVFAESAIIATDIAEVIGTAIALNVLLKIPLVAGCAISILDVLIILFWYRPDSKLKSLRIFECFVMLLVLGVVICFCFQLSYIKDTTVGEVFKGYLPSRAVVSGKGLYQSCGILGATVMPHSLYLGSGIVQSRLRDFDEKNNLSATPSQTSFSDYSNSDPPKYRPSVQAIRACLNYSIVETALSLFTFALFVNSSILIVAGASLYDNPTASEDADLFSIHDLLSRTLAPAAGTVFALALLLSGTSAGIVCTIAGQMVSEGQLNWSVKPWVRRLITRSIAITPSIVIAAAVGRNGLSRALEGSQVALSVILPFVSAPLIYFSCRSKVMTAMAGTQTPAAARRQEAQSADGGRGGEEDDDGQADGTEVRVGESAAGGVELVNMRIGYATTGVALLIWGVIVVMNVALLVMVGLGKD